MDFSKLDLNSLMQTAKDMQKQMAEKQEQAKNVEHSVSVGGGMVQMKINGGLEVKEVKVEPELLKPESKEELEDLLVIAMNEAIRKAKESGMGDMQSMMGNFKFPGM